MASGCRWWSGRAKRWQGDRGGMAMKTVGEKLVEELGYAIERRNYEIKRISGELFYGICKKCGLIVTGQYRDVKKRMMLHSCDA